MNKLLTIAVAALSATAMQAASIAWGGATYNSANQTSGWEGWAEAGTVYTLIMCGDTAPATPTSYDPATGLTYAGENASGALVASHTLTDSEANNGSWQGLYEAPADDINGHYFIATIYDSVSGKADYATFQVAGASDNGGSFDGASLMSNLGNSMGSVAVVPEPTTVALLALGLAAVGLKRKVA